MAQKQSFYDVLGVSKKATPDEIKKAFRKKAQKAHPDAGGSEEEFKRLNEAYEVLSDEQKRKEYDMFGACGGMHGAGCAGHGGAHGWPGANGTRVTWTTSGPGAGGSASFGGFGDLGSIFERISRGEGAWGTDWEMPKRPEKGRDIEVTLNLTFDEAFSGTTKKVRVRTQDDAQPREISVKVPAGATQGGKLKFRGKGCAGTGGGAAGDLIVTTKIAEHPLFTRDGADVLLNLDMTFTELALGTSVVVPTPDGGKVRLRIPAGTKDGTVFKVAQKGAPKLKSKQRGALKAIVHVAVPSELTAEQRELLQRLQETFDPQAVRPSVAAAVGSASGKA